MRLFQLNTLTDAYSQLRLGCALESGAAGSACVVADSQGQVVCQTQL